MKECQVWGPCTEMQSSSTDSTRHQVSIPGLEIVSCEEIHPAGCNPEVPNELGFLSWN